MKCLSIERPPAPSRLRCSFSQPRGTRTARDYHSFVFRESTVRNKWLIYCLRAVGPFAAFFGARKNIPAKYRTSSLTTRLIKTQYSRRNGATLENINRFLEEARV